MVKKQLHDCPVCGTGLRVKVLACPSCRTRIEGDFSPPASRLLSLGREELEFVEIFVRARGSIKEVEKILGISYPTVRGKLDDVIGKLGYKVTIQSADPGKRREILDRLEAGEINAADAARQLSGDSDVQ